MPKYRVWANIPHYTEVEASSPEQAKQLAVDEGGDGWEACYNDPQENDVYDVKELDDKGDEQEEVVEESIYTHTCPACGSTEHTKLGSLGNLTHYRCRACGVDFSD